MMMLYQRGMHVQICRLSTRRKCTQLFSRPEETSNLPSQGELPQLCEVYIHVLTVADCILLFTSEWLAEYSLSLPSLPPSSQHDYVYFLFSLQSFHNLGGT